MSIKDERLNKIIGILQCSAAQQINIVEVSGKHQLLSGPKLLLEVSNEEFDELGVYEIMERAGVETR